VRKLWPCILAAATDTGLGSTDTLQGGADLHDAMRTAGVVRR